MARHVPRRRVPGQLTSLGRGGNRFRRLETFPAPPACTTVTLTSSEVTAVCPVTGQPDWYTVTVTYWPKDVCVESKTFKLYLQAFRQRGLFCEAFAQQIALDLRRALHDADVQVKVKQVPRGGVAIETMAQAMGGNT